jgi:hypothetical protein
MKDPTAPHEQILSIVVGFWQARTVALATELDLAELVADRPAHVDELAQRTKTHPGALLRLLRALACSGIFTEVSPRVFGNTAVSECLRRDAPASQWAMVLHCLSKGFGPFEGWGELEHSVRTGEPAIEKIYGHDYFELLRRNPRASTAMNGAMRAATEAMTPAVTAAYDWSQLGVIADIGGGIGTQLVSILDASPLSRGVLLDQPHLAAEAIRHDRVEMVGGDFFEAVPAGADAYLLRFVLHDWDDADAARILGSVRRAIPPAGRLIVIESVLPEGEAFTFGKWTDLQMLVCAGGQERSEAEFRALLSKSQFDLQQVVATQSPLSLLIATPA